MAVGSVSGDAYTKFYRKTNGGSYKHMYNLPGFYELKFVYNNRIYCNWDCYGDYEFCYWDPKTGNKYSVKKGVISVGQNDNYVLLQEQNWRYNACTPLELYLYDLNTNYYYSLSSRTYPMCAAIGTTNKIYYGIIDSTSGSVSTIRIYKATFSRISGTTLHFIYEPLSGQIKNVTKCKRLTSKYIQYTSGNKNCTYYYVKSAQSISASNFTKVYGKDGAFYINAKRTKGNGKLSYKSNNTKVATVSSTGKITLKGVGKATITITAAETSAYKKCTKNITITVKPRGVSLSSLKTDGPGNLKIYWNKRSGVSGYQVQFATKSDYSNATTSKIAGASNYRRIVKGLTGGCYYYVRVRTYKDVSGTRYYSGWSASKKLYVASSASGDSSKNAKYVQLQDGKTYYYDITRDGTADTIKITYSNGYENGLMRTRVFINGKQHLYLGASRGVNVSYYEYDRENTFLLLNYHYAGGGNQVDALVYTNGKFESAWTNSFIEYYSNLAYQSSVLKVVGEEVHIIHQEKYETGSFEKVSEHLGSFSGPKFITWFRPDDGKLSLVTIVGKISGRTTFYAYNSFRTSSSANNSVQDGPFVSKGQKVTLVGVTQDRDTGERFYKIKVNGEYGWFKDCSDNLLTDKI